MSDVAEFWRGLRPNVLICTTVRVLQYRSVAFVTYVHELSGQFAKEAMACQSLDNDEILNVRYDSCPTSPCDRAP